jgi:SPP1 gp7 family putative phage head morphogenesis protein
VAVRFHSTPRDHAVQVQLGDMLARNLAAMNMLGRLHIVGHAVAKTNQPVRVATSSRLVKFAESDAHEDTFTAGFSFDLPAVGAIEYLRDLTPVTRQIFDGLTSQYRGDAFTIAGISDQRLIAKIRDALGDVLAKGGTRAQFRAAVDELTTDAGVEHIAAFDLDTVFSVNTGKAYSMGRLEQMREPSMLDALPFWQYWTVGDFSVRPEHAVLDGFIARAIDPVWAKIYPPSGFNCRCSVVPVPEDEALKMDPDGSEGGLERLPMLARALVPQRGFHTLIHA